jgi:hypothetical protein
MSHIGFDIDNQFFLLVIWSFKYNLYVDNFGKIMLHNTVLKTRAHEQIKSSLLRSDSTQFGHSGQ